VAGQDLAAAAAREKERREKAKKGKAFTNEDLSQGAPKKPSTEASPVATDGRPMDSERLRRLGGGAAGRRALRSRRPGEGTGVRG